MELSSTPTWEHRGEILKCLELYGSEIMRSNHTPGLHL